MQLRISSVSILNLLQRCSSAAIYLLGAILCFLLAGCDTLSFYGQAAKGQIQILRTKVPVEDLLSQTEIDDKLRAQLLLSQEIVDFADTHIGLSGGGRYRSYVDLQREYVVWNVFAAQPYRMEGKSWCYPIVGCAPYRGYFAEDAAQQLASELQQLGYETYIGPVPAYSTLGWFKDPILSSFIHWPAPDLASLLIHELAIVRYG